MPAVPPPLMETLPTHQPRSEQIDAVTRVMAFRAIHKLREAKDVTFEKGNIDELSRRVAYKAIYSYKQGMRHARKAE